MKLSPDQNRFFRRLTVAQSLITLTQNCAGILKPDMFPCLFLVHADRPVCWPPFKSIIWNFDDSRWFSGLPASPGSNGLAPSMGANHHRLCFLPKISAVKVSPLRLTTFPLASWVWSEERSWRPTRLPPPSYPRELWSSSSIRPTICPPALRMNRLLNIDLFPPDCRK
jgi:hypothetical protein